MKHLFKGIKHLTNKSIEDEFKRLITSSLFEEIDLFVDLSQLTFAQLSAINYLCLKIDEIFKTNRIKTFYISYPLKRYSAREMLSTDKKFTNELKANLLRNRIKVNGFLKNVHLASAIKVSALDSSIEACFTEIYDFESEFNHENFENAFEEVTSIDANTQSGYKYLYPLEWITVDDIFKNYEEIESRFNKILENSDRGLETFDVQAIKNVIFSELSKNVKEHALDKSENKKFLLSIGLVSTSSFKKVKLKDNIEKSFIEWCLQEKIPSLIEIYFGDTGGGFYTDTFKAACEKDNIKAKEEQLKWSFSKWTSKKFSEKRRGTKGLYRINRIVNKYNGIFHIITNDQNGGYRKGGVRNPQWINRNISASLGGSFIQIKLCPYSEIKKFKLKLVNNHKEESWITFSISSDTPKEVLLQKIEIELRSDRKILCIIDLDKNKSLSDSERLSLLKSLLDGISFNSHPSGVVVYVNSLIDKSSIDTTIDSLNEYIKSIKHLEISEDKDNEIIFDPIIVLFGDSTFWYGGNQNVVNILNEVYSNNFKKKIEELESFQNIPRLQRIKIRQSLENDNRLVHVNSNGQIELVFTDIEALFSKMLQQKILDSLKETKRVCTPKLYISDYWLNVKHLIKDNELGFALVLYLKSLKYINPNSIEQLYILIDHKQHIELAQHLLSLFNLKDKYLINIQNEIQANSLKRFKLIPEKSNVIILTSIVSSSETIRRLVKYIRRDNANPMLVLCLCNFRKHNIEELQTWGSKTKIESLFNKYQSGQNKEIKDLSYFNNKFDEINSFTGEIINPNFTKTERNTTTLIDIELLKHLENSKAINYNHVGIKNDRHFTFYIDKFKLLNSENLITRKINKTIDNWLKQNEIKEYTIYIKDDLLLNRDGNFKEYLEEKHNNIVIYNEVPLIEVTESIVALTDKSLLNAFIIDFGLISGGTVNQMLRSFNGLDNVFICILFNQSNNNMFDHYKRLHSLNNPENIKKTPTNLNINFLFNLPLKYFSRENCPICNHIDALEYYKMSDEKQDFMFKFSEDRQRRLQIRNKTEISREEYPFDYYYEYPNKRKQELSSTIIAEMFNLKLLLEDALHNTNSRIDLFKYIFNIYSNLSNQLPKEDSHLYALIFLLSNEVHWLQKEPLNFRDYRSMLTTIAKKISTVSLEDLIDSFGQSAYNVNLLDIATRYKYSAISLLRSSNKLEFCKSIGEIVKSTSNENRFSNNLLQNCFYHTYSILTNKYNKSEKYFSELRSSYKTVSDITEIPVLNDDGSNGPKSTIERLSNLITSKLTEIDIENLDDLDILKQLKIIYNKEYLPFSHPELEKALGEKSLIHLSHNIALKDIAEKKEQSRYYQALQFPLRDLFQQWLKINYHIHRNILPYYKRLSNKFKNSRAIKNDYPIFPYLEAILKYNNNNPVIIFGSLVAKLSSNPLSYLEIKEDYDNYHKLFYDVLIKKDSIFNNFINQLPLNISGIIDQTFFLNIFESHNINGEDEGSVFYPVSRFKTDLKSMISSIESRCLTDEKEHFRRFGKFKSISCKIDFSIQKEAEYKYFVISYNHTESSPHIHPNNEIGGLNSIKQEVRKFGGDVLFEPENDKEGFFNITFKFLRYD